MIKAYWEDLQAADHGATDEFAKKRPDLAGTIDKVDSDEDARNLDKDSFKDKALRDRLQNTAGKEKGKTAYDEILEGKHGNAKRDALSKFHPEAPPPESTPTTALVQDGKFNAESGEFADDATEKQFTVNITQNIKDIGNISSDLIDSKDGDNAIVEAVGGLDAGEVKRLMKQYARGNPAERASLKPTVDNLRRAMEHAGKLATGDNKNKIDKMKLVISTGINRATSSPRSIPSAPAAAEAESVPEAATGMEIHDALEQLNKRIAGLANLRGASNPFAGQNQQEYDELQTAVRELGDLVRQRELKGGALLRAEEARDNGPGSQEVVDRLSNEIAELDARIKTSVERTKKS